MVDRIAIKRLTASDCTLFEAVWKKIGAGNQKSINLNADVLTGELYPGLAATAAATDNEIAVAVSIYGPGEKTAHKLSRKIIKNSSYKNWRLNGEFIPGPPDDPSRYDEVHPWDFVIMVFKGEVSPTGMDLILVSQADPADVALHASLAPLFGNRSMVRVTAEQLSIVATAAAVQDTHPIFIAAADPEMDSVLEDAAQGGFEGANKLLKNKGGQKVSASGLAKAKAKAELTGRNGEGLVNAYLAGHLAAGHIASYRWASDENAVAPFDFETFTSTGERTLIDAKSTSGPFENAIHISLAEIIEASGEVTYRIYRVFELDDDGGKLCVSEDIRPLALHLKTIHEAHMPGGVRVDGYSVTTGVLSWSPEEYVDRPEEEGAN